MCIEYNTPMPEVEDGIELGIIFTENYDNNVQNAVAGVNLGLAAGRSVRTNLINTIYRNT